MVHWFADQLCYAQYALVPVGNLEGTEFLADVMFARSGTIPSIFQQQLERCVKISVYFGFQEQIFLILVVVNVMTYHVRSKLKSYRLLFLVGELVNPEVCEPGLYTSFCIEISISGLALNTIIQASKLWAQEVAKELLFLV